MRKTVIALGVAAALGSFTANGVPTGIDWESEDFKSESSRNQISKNLTDYYKEVRAANDVKGFYGSDKYGVKYLTGASGLPASSDPKIDFYGPRVDQGVFSLFEYIDKRGSKNPTYEYGHVSAQSIVFEQKKEGAEVKIRKVNGGSTDILKSVTWEGALGITGEAKRFDEYTIFENNVQRVPAMYSDRQATALATLVTALGVGVDETWDTDLITTINNAAAQILDDVGEDYGLPENPGFVLLHNHRQASAVKKALASDLTLANDNNSATELNFDIMPVATRKIPAGSMYLAIPGFDMVLVEWDELWAEFGRDWARDVDAHIWRGRWNAGIGNTGQVRRVPISA